MQHCHGLVQPVGVGVCWGGWRGFYPLLLGEQRSLGNARVHLSPIVTKLVKVQGKDAGDQSVLCPSSWIVSVTLRGCI